jgi:hypothetical protein
MTMLATAAPNMKTLGEIARATGRRFYQVAYIVKTRGIVPDMKAGIIGLYGKDAQRRIADALTEIDERKGAA